MHIAHLEALLTVQSCFFTVLFVVRSWIFGTLSEGHCGRCALHLSHALEAFCCSAKRLGDVMGNDLECPDLLFLKMGYMSYQYVCLQICYSLEWVTCHTNMSVCVVMLLPGVSSHGGALK